MKSKIAPILGAALLLGLSFDWLFYGKIPGVSVVIYTLVILCVSLFLARQFKAHLNQSVYGLMPLVFFFAFMVFVRANEFLTFLNILLVIYLLLLMTRLAVWPDRRLKQLEVKHYFNFIGLPFRFLREAVQTFKQALNNRANIHQAAYIPILRGILISLPILFIFVLLLSSADMVFKKYADSLFSLHFDGETVFRWGLIGFVTSLFTGAYALIFMRPAKHEITSSKQKNFGLGATEATIILSSVSLLFFIFVMIQLAYLFGGADQVTHAGYTYAEYARKGFFELITVGMITLLLLWSIKRAVEFRSLSQALVFKWLSAVLIAEVLVIMLSAHLRLDLYEDAYGFTMQRLLSHLFILWLASAFILLFIYIFRDEKENQFALRLFISAIGFFVLLNLINPDAFIARQNINRFHQTGKVDVYYLQDLSFDAVPVIAKQLESPNKELRSSAANALSYIYDFRQQGDTHWQSTNLSYNRAKQILRDKSWQIESEKTTEADPPGYVD